MGISDNSFIEDLKKKHPKSLDYIIDNYSGLVNTIVRKTLISIDDRGIIEECISDVFIAVWENGYKFKGDRYKFKSWIAGIAKYKSIDYFRKYSRKVNNEVADEDMPDKRCLEDDYISNIEAKRLIKIIMSYDEPDKSIFIRKFLLGESSSEISKAIGITINNINTRIFRGRQKIKKEFYGEEEVL
ncbi:MAG: sigma-70 family RNA polymerase sigma factor [Clostridium sp.]|jgi:RNA polymerase sigma factor, sigma-70 family|uniref:sigma-70 family RNA polymerase sigma factor n=1 Tax=Clostridium sp. TaxID=1506 RepID=UPI0025B82A4A|nr:sigma-70 family RNA polymerase sigma factor [Clostridium sp.]MDY6226155.1 sigma-70 family RNA polymerase sigma factor [Clostridium sp.]